MTLLLRNEEVIGGLKARQHRLTEAVDSMTNMTTPPTNDDDDDDDSLMELILSLKSTPKE
jgi:hypothetical protein